MTTYSKNYRKIYEEHFGPIPVDSSGKKYHIHHIDGDRNNNDPSNLVALTIQEHYDVHFSQGDYGACFMLAKYMKMTPEEMTNIATINAKRRLAEGTHNFINLNQKRISEGTHNFLKKEDGSSLGKEISMKRSQNGTHVWIKNKDSVPCYNKKGVYVRISKEDYYSQTGPMDEWEWAFNTSKEGERRRLINDPSLPLLRTTKGTVPCISKTGETKRITKEEYHSQTGPMYEWEWVFNMSKEGKLRKSSL